MPSSRTKLILHGAVAEAVGCAEWEFLVETPAEALQAVEVNSDGKLLNYLYDNMDQEFRLFINGKGLTDLDEMLCTRPENTLKEVHLLPVIKGSEKGGGLGTWLLVIGIAIIAIILAIPTAGGSVAGGASAVSGLTAVLSSSYVLTSTASFFMMVGVTLALTGLARMMTPEPPKDEEKPENQVSYLFGGAVNTYRQGNPIPVGFGMLQIGSQVISAGIYSVDITDTTAA